MGDKTMQYGKLAGLLAAVGVAMGGGWWLSSQQMEKVAAVPQQAAQAQQKLDGQLSAEDGNDVAAPSAAVQLAEAQGRHMPQASVAPSLRRAANEAAGAGAQMPDKGGKLAAAATGRAGVADAASQSARSQLGSVEVMLQTMGDVMATMGGTVARVADTFIVVLSGELEQTKRLAAGEGGDDLADVVRQMEAREELQRPGLKGPIRRFMDKYCILGYLTGKGTCDR